MLVCLLLIMYFMHLEVSDFTGAVSLSIHNHYLIHIGSHAKIVQIAFYILYCSY